MRNTKYILLIAVSLVLTLVGCSKSGKEVPSAQDSIRKNHAIRILTDARYAPFEFGASTGTGVQGLDVDLGNEIGKSLGVDVKWIEFSSVMKAQGKSTGQAYNRLFELLGNGEVEMIVSAVAIDPSRTNEFAFSHPYYDTGNVIAHQRSDFSIKDLASLSGKKVGVAEGRPGDTFISTQKTAPNVLISRFQTLDDALGALNRTEIDAVVGDQPMITYSSFKSFPNTLILPATLDHYQYAVVVRKGDTDLLDKANETIDRLKSSGDMQAMATKWIGNVQQEAANVREKTEKEEALRKGPKTINVNINKVSGPIPMDRLDGFVLVLEGATGRYESTPILTDGNKGACKFARPVPPGEYKLNMSVIRLTNYQVAVPELAKPSMTMGMNISATGMTISWK